MNHETSDYHNQISFLMSYSSLAKKLQPAKKAIKNLSKKFESKLNNFTFSKAVNVIKKTSDRLRSYYSDHHLRSFFQKRPTYRYRHRHHHHRRSNNIYQYYYKKKNKDRSASTLQTKYFHSHSEPSSSHSSSSSNVNKRIRRAKTTTDVKDLDGEKGKEKILYSIEDAWREVVAKSPQLRPVDERAEEFITNFRQGMRLQNQKSILGYVG
ncbi:hypothetical protein M5689_006033 [Euphorbia peplus]|nr:hypothetical protein M5689_006033 [Euphorbia peplus]